ncbi:uncharacterized protein AB675_1352 [Cyphellophora attinorum]|uniref:Alpha/beta hydrolase fold-3 domain-containing protein n=1 Tax=Cyphellophora attinorum TaxID=1664694 RepID=A0A0N0NHV1_9EURO|nr:uncharacterized protein AB675_1352 [Phialophora attinorum]KPI35101.1 hypothetical protein AB675_1352 [Phialophora attinorum]
MAVPVMVDFDLADRPHKRKIPATMELPRQTADGNVEIATTQLPVDPLEGFVKIRDKVHLYTPTETTASAPNDPGFIIICSWAFARPRHISKYLKGYQGVYPNSQILLVQQEIDNMLFRRDAAQRPMFDPAAKAIHEYVESVADRTPRILLQTYSNGGSHGAVQLAECYKNLFGQDLPISAIVMDSTPGKPHYNETISALQTSLPKSWFSYLVGSAMIHAAISSTIVIDRLGIAELATYKLYRVLNDPEGAFLKSHIPRTYIHSQKDVMILSRDVEAHAEFARALMAEKGASGEMVTVEEFIDTPHVFHMASDPERYWSIIRSTWAKAQH